MATTGVRTGVRRFVLAFLVVYLVASAAGVEAWPLTGWGLYSRRLTDHVSEWKLVTVDGAGDEHAIPWRQMPMAYRSTYRQLGRVVAAPPAEQERACRAWAAGVRALGDEVVAVRIYRTETRRRFDGPSAVVDRRLALTCAADERGERIVIVARAEAWLFGEESPARLRVCQTGLAALVALRLIVTPYHELAGQPAALFDPPWFLSWMPAMPSAAVIVAIQAVGAAAALAAALPFVTPARLRRLAFVAGWVCLLVVAGLRASRGKIMHNDLLLLFVCVPFLAAPFVSAAEARLRPSSRFGWPVRAAMVVIATAYFRAGVGKLLASGVAWVASDNMRWILLSAARQEKAPTETVSMFIVDRPWLAVLAAGALLAVELSAPLILFWSRFRAPFAVAVVGLHVGTWLTIGLDYSAWALVVPLVVVDWPAVLARWRPARVPTGYRLPGVRDSRR